MRTLKAIPVIGILIWIGVGPGAELRAASSVPATPSSLTAPAGPTFTGRRGVGGMPTFFFPRQHPLDPNRYDIDPYSRWDTTMPRWRLDEIKHAGFDFLRLVIDPGPLLESEGEMFDRRISKLKGAIESSLAAGLKILVDVHVRTSHPMWGQFQITAGFDHPAFRRYIEVVQALGRLASAYDPEKLALEVFNEPPGPCQWRDRPDWPEQLDMIYSVARRAAPDQTLVVSGSCWASIKGLVRLDGSKFDKNTVFSFHYYDPFVFTHQSFWGSMKFLEYISRLPYPPGSANIEEVLDAVEQRIRATPSLSDDQRVREIREAAKHLRAYFANWKGAANIERDFNEVQQWANRYGIQPKRILLGEFGVMKDVYGHKGADPADRIRWLSDTRMIAEKFGYSWSVWSFTGAMGMTVRDTDGPLDSSMLKALGPTP
jgi:hypothetical protein